MNDIAKNYLSENRLDEALAALQNQIKQDPNNVDYRLFLFQLLIQIGNFERAEKQLQLIAKLDSQLLPFVSLYQQLIAAESERVQVYTHASLPNFIGEPQSWLLTLHKLFKELQLGQLQNLSQLKELALELAPVVSGEINGQAFSWLTDTDDRLGPVFELLLNGQYYWLSQTQISTIKFHKPKDQSDAVWLPVELKLTSGDEVTGFTVSRYFGSEKDTDDAVRLTKKTIWTDLTDGFIVPFGQKTFATDVDDYPLFEINEIRFFHQN